MIELSEREASAFEEHWGVEGLRAAQGGLLDDLAAPYVASVVFSEEEAAIVDAAVERLCVLTGRRPKEPPAGRTKTRRSSPRLLVEDLLYEIYNAEAFS